MVVRYLASAALGPVLCAGLCMGVLGCADTKKAPATQPLTLEQRNQKIFDDPMSVGPNEDPTFVTKNGLGPDDRPTLKKDIDNFLNP